KHYWIMRGLMGLGLRVMVEALERPGAEAHTADRCRVLSDAGTFEFLMGRYPEAQKFLLESLVIAREMKDRRSIAGILQPLGLASMALGDKDSAGRELNEALALARELGNKREVAAALTAVAQFHRLQGDLNAAEPLYSAANELAREIGD